MMRSTRQQKLTLNVGLQTLSLRRKEKNDSKVDIRDRGDFVFLAEKTHK